jgi:RNA recognition motif-containing protein
MKNKPSSTVYISNLSYERDRNGLRSLFKRYGTIKQIKIIVEPRTNQSRGMAFVEMGSIEEATAAIKDLNGRVIDGRTAKANFAIPQLEEKKFYPAKVDKAEPKKKKEKDLDFTNVQLAKKARNEARRKSNPLQFKVPTKKKTTK